MSTTPSPIPVMVTGVGGAGLGEQIVKSLRLADTPYEIIGGDMHAYSAGLGLVDHPYQLPAAREPDYLETLLKVCRRHKVKAIFHGSDPELKVLSASRERLADEGYLVPMNPREVLRISFDKNKTAEHLSSLGYKVPPFARVRSVSDALKFGRYPSLLKPSTASGGSANINLAQNEEELRLGAESLLSIFDEITIQEYVGTPDQEYTVGVLLDMDGVLLNSIAVHRIITVPLSNKILLPNRTDKAELGPVIAVSSGISQGRIGRYEEVTRPCEALALALGARGAINIQCRLVKGEVYVFEINPRFSGTSSLRAMVGYNEPDILIRRHILGEKIEPHFPYRSGTIMRGLAEVVVPMDKIVDAREL